MNESNASRELRERDMTTVEIAHLEADLRRAAGRYLDAVQRLPDAPDVLDAFYSLVAALNDLDQAIRAGVRAEP